MANSADLFSDAMVGALAAEIDRFPREQVD